MKSESSGIGYRRRGGGAGKPVVVLVHGIPGSAGVWDGVVSRLPDDVDVIVPDLLGFGESDRPTTIEALHAQGQAAALERLLGDTGVERAIVIGHDFGGPTAVALHARIRDRIVALGLLATNVFTDTPVPFPLTLATLPLVGRPLSRALFSGPSLAMVMRMGVGRPRTRLDRAAYLGDRRQQKAIRTIFGESLRSLASLYEPIERELAQISVPTAVAWGDHDTFFTVEDGRRTAEAVGAELTILEGAGHFLPDERPGEVASLIEGLVGQV
jgi:pimeloyl-ACP methyl ester carboxylesterase